MEGVFKSEKCTVCLDAEVELIFRPCSHACTCKDCGYKIIMFSMECPLCRKLIQYHQEVYIEVEKCLCCSGKGSYEKECQICDGQICTSCLFKCIQCDLKTCKKCQIGGMCKFCIKEGLPDFDLCSDCGTFQKKGYLDLCLACKKEKCHECFKDYQTFCQLSHPEVCKDCLVEAEAKLIK